MLKSRALTANEAAAASRVPLKQVNRIIDAGLLEGAVETRQGARMIRAPALIALKLAYVTAEVLKPAARREAVLNVLTKPAKPTIQHHPVRMEMGALEAELREGLEDLAQARAMVEIDGEIMGGAPCFLGSRIPVHDIADMLCNGDTAAAIASAYPSLDDRRIKLALVYASAYPRRGRPRNSARRALERKSSERMRLEDLPPA
jgi:uncharacterized protein (DUF433 family)